MTKSLRHNLQHLEAKKNTVMKHSVVMHQWHLEGSRNKIKMLHHQREHLEDKKNTVTGQALVMLWHQEEMRSMTAELHHQPQQLEAKMLTVTGLPLAMNWRLDGKSNTLQVLQHQMWAVVRRVLFHRYFTDVRSHLFISSRMILNQRLPDQKYINLLLGLPCNNLFDFGKVPNKLFYHLIATIHRRKVLIHIYKDRRLLTEAHRKVDVVNHT